MDNNIDVAKIMEEIIVDAEKKYGNLGMMRSLETNNSADNLTDTAVNNAIDNISDISQMQSDMKDRIQTQNNRLIAAIQKVRSYDGIHWRVSNYEHSNPLLRAPFKFVAKIVSKLTRFITFQQNDVNNTLANTIDLLKDSIWTLFDFNSLLIDHINSLHYENKQLMDRIVSISDTNNRLEEFVNTEMASWHDENTLLKDRIKSLLNQNDLVEKCTKEITQLHDENTLIKDRIAFLHDENTLIKDRITFLHDENTLIKDKATSLRNQNILLGEHIDKIDEQMNVYGNEILKLSDTVEQSGFDDSMYLRFENQNRGAEDDIKSHMQFYIENFILPCVLPKKEGLVIDIGCGRGEWLELLRENGYEGVGVDINEASLERCRQKNIENYCIDAIEYLKSLHSNSVKILTSFQVVEHLPMKYLVEMFQEIGRVLQKDGIIIMETPNPANVHVGACSFYVDPTHKKPLPSELLTFIAQDSGLKDIEIAYWQQQQIDQWWDSIWQQDSSNEIQQNKFNAVIEGMQKNLWCSADYALIARK